MEYNDDVRELLTKFKKRVKSALDSVRENTGQDCSKSIGMGLKAFVPIAAIINPDFANDSLCNLVCAIEEYHGLPKTSPNLVMISSGGSTGNDLYHIVQDKAARRELEQYIQELSQGKY